MRFVFVFAPQKTHFIFTIALRTTQNNFGTRAAHCLHASNKLWNLFSALCLPLIKGGLTRQQPRLMTAPLAEFKRVRALAHVTRREVRRQVRRIKL